MNINRPHVTRCHRQSPRLFVFWKLTVEVYFGQGLRYTVFKCENANEKGTYLNFYFKVDWNLIMVWNNTIWIMTQELLPSMQEIKLQLGAFRPLIWYVDRTLFLPTSLLVFITTTKPSWGKQIFNVRGLKNTLSVNGRRHNTVLNVDVCMEECFELRNPALTSW